MLYYPSKIQSKQHGGRRVMPERITRRIMVNPNYSVRRIDLDGTLAICDSGAFQDINAVRLAPWSALDRQLRYEEQLRWRGNDHGWHFEAVVIYDEMAGVDETVVNGKKVKQRGTADSARAAVAETLRAAAYYNSQRHRIAGRLMFVGQGADPDQYIEECVRPMLPLLRPGDYFGFGGFCILGRQRSLLPVFCETFARALDVLAPLGIRRYHLLGVCLPQAVEYAAALAHERGVVLSNDSSATEFGAVFKGVVYEGGRSTTLTLDPAARYVDWHPVDLAHQNIAEYSRWAYGLGANTPRGCSCGAVWEPDDPDISLAVRGGFCPVCTAPLSEELWAA